MYQHPRRSPFISDTLSISYRSPRPGCSSEVGELAGPPAPGQGLLSSRINLILKLFPEHHLMTALRTAHLVLRLRILLYHDPPATQANIFLQAAPPVSSVPHPVPSHTGQGTTYFPRLSRPRITPEPLQTGQHSGPAFLSLSLSISDWWCRWDLPTSASSSESRYKKTGTVNLEIHP